MNKELANIQKALDNYIKKNQEAHVSCSVWPFNNKADVVKDMIWEHGERECLLIDLVERGKTMKKQIKGEVSNRHRLCK